MTSLTLHGHVMGFLTKIFRIFVKSYKYPVKPCNMTMLGKGGYCRRGGGLMDGFFLHGTPDELLDKVGMQ